jgi:(2Fe-2S) ferredoxin
MARPQYHLFICSTVRPPGHPRGSCGDRGCREVLDEFMFQQQQRQLPHVMITACGCLGPCGQGPNILIYPEGTFYGGVTRADVATIFEQHLVAGDVVERLKVAADLW